MFSAERNDFIARTSILDIDIYWNASISVKYHVDAFFGRQTVNCGSLDMNAETEGFPEESMRTAPRGKYTG